MRSRWFTICMIICLLPACSLRHNDYSCFCDIPHEGWRYGDTLSYMPAIGDSIATGTLCIVIRHTNGYEYSNLWMEISMPAPDMTTVDTIDMVLADDFGKWYGKGLGVSYQATDTIYKDVTIFKDRPIHLRHIMRADTLPDIEQVGLIFTETSYR